MSSCLGVLLELHIPDLLAKETKPIALNDVRFLLSKAAPSCMPASNTLVHLAADDNLRCCFPAACTEGRCK